MTKTIRFSALETDLSLRIEVRCGDLIDAEGDQTFTDMPVELFPLEPTTFRDAIT